MDSYVSGTKFSLFPSRWYYSDILGFLFIYFFNCPITKSYLTLCNPMDCSMPDFAILIVSQSLNNYIYF